MAGWILRAATVSPAAAAHLAVRWLGFPSIASIERRLPQQGVILDAGCGHGLLALLAAARGPDREIVGVDLLEDRVAFARTLAAGAGLTNARFEKRSFDPPPQGPFDAIIIADALFYCGLPEQRRILAALSAELAPGGRLFVSEQTAEPRWKAALVALQERAIVAFRVRLAGKAAWASIAPTGVHLWPAEGLAETLRSLGLSVESLRLDRGCWLSHRLFIAEAAEAREREAAAPIAR